MYLGKLTCCENNNILSLPGEESFSCIFGSSVQIVLPSLRSRRIMGLRKSEKKTGRER